MEKISFWHVIYVLYPKHFIASATIQVFDYWVHCNLLSTKSKQIICDKITKKGRSILPRFMYKMVPGNL